MDLRYLKPIRFDDVLYMWGKGKDDEQDRKGSLLVSSLCTFISDDVHDVEHLKFTGFGFEMWKL